LFINCMFHVQRVLNELQVCLLGRISHCSNWRVQLSSSVLMWHLINDLLSVL